MVGYTRTAATESGKPLGGEMKLPFDILFDIIQVQAAERNAHDLSAMMRCCRVLREEGAKHLLGCGVTLRNDPDVQSFSKFMLADKEHRLPALNHSLTICSTSMSHCTAKALVKVVQSISHLQRLVLHDADLLFASAPSVATALTSLRCLKHLEYRATGHCDQHVGGNDFLKDLQSQLHSATLHLPQDEHVAPYSQYSFLLHSKDTLTELHATNIDSLLMNSPDTHVFPAVRRLVLHCEAPSMSLFSQTFPNITSLDFTCSCPYEHEFLRNFAELEAGPDGVVPWSALESITGTMEDLYYVGLCQRVANVHVRWIVVEDMKQLLYLEDVLKSTTPSRLRLDIDLEVFRSGKYKALQKMFMEAGQLDDMRLDIVVRGVRRETELEKLDGWVSCMVKPLRFASWKSQALPDLLQNTICGGIGRASIEESSDELDAGSSSDKLNAGSSSDEDLD